MFAYDVGLAVAVAPDVKTEMTVPELRRNTDHHLKFRNELYAAIEELKIRRVRSDIIGLLAAVGLYHGGLGCNA